MAFKIQRFIPASPITMPNPDPVKEVKQAKKPSKKNIDPKPIPKQKIDKDPVKYFNSFPSKATQKTAKNPYPKDSVRNRKFSQLQNKLRNSSR